MDTAYEKNARKKATQRAAFTKTKTTARRGGEIHKRRGFTIEVKRIAATIPTETIAAAVDAHPRTVRTWLAGTGAPTGQRARQLTALGAVTDRLPRIMAADYIPVWMVKPIEALDDHTPAETIASGDARRVLQLISSLESPGAA